MFMSLCKQGSLDDLNITEFSLYVKKMIFIKPTIAKHSWIICKYKILSVIFIFWWKEYRPYPEPWYADPSYKEPTKPKLEKDKGPSKISVLFLSFFLLVNMIRF